VAVPDSLNDSAWIAHLCLIICASAILIVGAAYFHFVLVPLTMAWFFSFLIGPILDMLEQRPLVLFGSLCTACMMTLLYRFMDHSPPESLADIAI
jgi:predicted PurR-regulated permease PerM